MENKYGKNLIFRLFELREKSTGNISKCLDEKLARLTHLSGQWQVNEKEQELVFSFPIPEMIQ
jgi:ribosomal protein L29